jgi:hypothetical protein
MENITQSIGTDSEAFQKILAQYQPQAEEPLTYENMKRKVENFQIGKIFKAYNN